MGSPAGPRPAAPVFRIPVPARGVAELRDAGAFAGDSQAVALGVPPERLHPLLSEETQCGQVHARG